MTSNHRFELEVKPYLGLNSVEWGNVNNNVSFFAVFSPLKKYNVSAQSVIIRLPEEEVGEDMAQDLKRKILKGNCS